MLPFTVNLTRLTQKEIDKYTKKSRIADKPDLTIVVHKLPLQPQQTVILAPPKQPRTPVSPAIIHSKTRAHAPKVPKQKISRKLSELPQPKPTFQVRRHVLKPRKTKAYLKCRVAGCLMAYITFNTVQAINAHHRLYHHQVTYNCNTCHKMVPTPNALRLHSYCHCAKMHKCKDCDQSFVHPSKLQQHQ